MATVTPNGVIRICKGVPLSNDYKHTLWFRNDVAFYDYFSSKVAKTYSRYNIIRDTDALIVEATYEEARTWNYMYFQNNGTGGPHIYFAFITRVEYVNELTVKLHYEIDVMMSYYWSYTLNQCFVEREHSASDAYYSNLVDEGLEVGELVDHVTWYPEIGELCMLVMSSVDINQSTPNPDNAVMATGYKLNNSYSSMYIYAFDFDHIATLNTALKNMNAAGLTDAILAIWMYPKALVQLKSGHTWSTAMPIVSGINRIEQEIIPAPHFDGYYPKNNKLYSYPYNFIYVTNNAGGSAVYKHELVKNNSPQSTMNNVKFVIGGAISPEASVRMYPTSYRKKGHNFEEGIALGTYPSCAWNSDTYKLWLAQNQNQLNQSIKSTILSSGATAVTSLISGIGLIAAQQYVPGALAIAGGVGGSALSGYTQVSSLMAQKADMDIQPPNSKGSYTANINIAEGYQTFTVSRRTLTAQQAQMIDEYFTRFGYACRRIKVPNVHARKSFTYVKTVDCQITANLSHDIIQKIQSVYDNGVTIWADPAVVGVYTCDNSCL